jgi:hypothetical protein
VTPPTNRRRFLVETCAEGDALIRVLTPFAVQGAELAAVSLARAGPGLAIRIEADGLEPRRADTLLRRLEALPVVRSVRVG